MQKLKYDVIKKLMSCPEPITSTEINLLVYLSHYQCDRGSIIGVYYKTVCEELKISFQAFYDALYGLQRKDIIKIKKGSYYDWDVLILDNNFNFEIESPSYLNTGTDMFHSKKFYDMKANEKILAMYIMIICGNKGMSYRIGKEAFYQKFTAIFHVTKRALQNYLQILKQFFSIGLKAKKYWITPKNSAKEKVSAPKDKDIFAKGIAAAAFRRTRAVINNSKAYHEIEYLCVQYFNDYKSIVPKSFMRAVESSIALRNRQTASKYKWNRELSPAFVHKLLRRELGIEDFILE